ncbi:hypothetical protein QBC45DRAFT_329824 [Copromyces sp. CBS 386.78]|nr:hypothetical protein QBC45DRAFT_329824 [Copromyces sp. CBS 386.78]
MEGTWRLAENKRGLSAFDRQSWTLGHSRFRIPNINNDFHQRQQGGHEVEFPAVGNLRKLNLISDFISRS